MSYSNLLDRMKQRDTDAFLEFTDRYGWVLYSSIRKKHANKVDADKVYHETLQQLWSCLQNEEFEDPMEAILCAFADNIALKRNPRKDLAEIFYGDPDEKPPVMHIRRSEEDPPQTGADRKITVWSVLLIVFLLAVFGFSVWIILGLLMEHGTIAYVDLGYSWFCSLLEQMLSQWGLY